MRLSKHPGETGAMRQPRIRTVTDGRPRTTSVHDVSNDLRPLPCLHRMEFGSIPSHRSLAHSRIGRFATECACCASAGLRSSNLKSRFSGLRRTRGGRHLASVRAAGRETSAGLTPLRSCGLTEKRSTTFARGAACQHTSCARCRRASSSAEPCSGASRAGPARLGRIFFSSRLAAAESTAAAQAPPAADAADYAEDGGQGQTYIGHRVDS